MSLTKFKASSLKDKQEEGLEKEILEADGTAEKAAGKKAAKATKGRKIKSKKGT